MLLYDKNNLSGVLTAKTNIPNGPRISLFIYGSVCLLICYSVLLLLPNYPASCAKDFIPICMLLFV